MLGTLPSQDMTPVSYLSRDDSGLQRTLYFSILINQKQNLPLPLASFQGSLFLSPHLESIQHTLTKFRTLQGVGIVGELRQFCLRATESFPSWNTSAFWKLKPNPKLSTEWFHFLWNYRKGNAIEHKNSGIQELRLEGETDSKRGGGPIGIFKVGILCCICI